VDFWENVCYNANGTKKEGRTVFEKLTLAMRERVETIRKNAAHTLSSHAFVSLFLWAEEKEYEIAFCENAFVIRSPECCFFPCGEKQDVLALLDSLTKSGTVTFRYARREDVALAEEVFGDRVRASFDDTAREYLYDRKEQIAMQGKKFTYQRAKCNKARRLGEITSLPLRADNVSAAEEITRLWASRREDPGDAAMTLRALSLVKELSLIGNILFLDGEAVGFDLGSMIADDTLDIHIAKTLRDDVDTLMKLFLYQSLPETVTVINREEDLGIRGLRMHKLDAQPSGFHDIYTLTVQRD